MRSLYSLCYLPLCLSTLLPVLGLEEGGTPKVQGRSPWPSPGPASAGAAMGPDMAATVGSVVTGAGAGVDMSMQCPPGADLDYQYCVYQEDLTPIRQSWAEDSAFLPTTIVYSLAFVLGVTGNTLVMFALLGDRKARNVTSSFLVSLALADMVFLLVCVPYDLGIKMQLEWAGGMALCKIFGFVEMLSAAASVLNLTAVSVERSVSDSFLVQFATPFNSFSSNTCGNLHSTACLYCK